MKHSFFNSIFIAMLLVSLQGIQAFASQQTDTLKIDRSILKRDTLYIKDIVQLKGKNIYGDLIPNSTQYYGGSHKDNINFLSDQYHADNVNQQQILVERNSVSGLYFLLQDSSINKVVIFESKYVSERGYFKGNPIILLIEATQVQEESEIKDSVTVSPSNVIEDSKIKKGDDNKSFNMDYIIILLQSLCLICLICLLLNKQKGVQSSEASREDVINKVFQEYSSKYQLNRSDLEKLFMNNINRILRELEKLQNTNYFELQNVLKANMSQLQATLQSCVSHEHSLGNRQNNQESKPLEAIRCGYAPLPLFNETALTITDNPSRTAFVISKCGTDYIVGLSEDEQILSQLVQPFTDLKMKGSKIVDFPDGELQNAKKVLCIENGIFRMNAEGKLEAVKPLQIRRG